MNSRDAQKLYSGYLEGELSVEEEETLRSFLASSPEAASDYRAFEATVELLRSLPREEANDGMTDQIMARVRRARVEGDLPLQSVKRERRKLRQLAPLAAMLVLGFVSAFVVLTMADGPRTADVASDAPATESLTPLAATPEDGTPSDGPDVDRSEWNRLDRPLRQVGSGTESPSIVF